MGNCLTFDADALDQQTPTVHGETSVTVSHEDLRFVKTAISTMPGGLLASADRYQRHGRVHLAATGTRCVRPFHPDAHMFGHIGPMDTYEPITDFTALVEKQPGLAGPNYRADVRTIDLVGDAGVAVLVEDGLLRLRLRRLLYRRAHRWSLVDHEQDVRPHRRRAARALRTRPGPRGPH